MSSEFVITDSAQILSVLGFSAIVSGSVSAAVNYVLTIVEFRKKRKIEFQFSRLEDRLRTYSLLIYNLNLTLSYFRNINTYKNKPDEMLKKIGKRYEFMVHEFDKLLIEIDDTLPGKLYLLAPDIPRRWLRLRSSGSFQLSDKEDELDKLLDRIEKEYYGNILVNYNNLLGKYSDYLRFDSNYVEK